jgi:hypothetical protein
VSNPYYTNSTTLLPLTRARAVDVEDKLSAVEAGFDAVVPDVNRALKLPNGTADQTISLTAGQRANLLLSFDGNGNISTIAGGGRFRGDWVTGTLYVVADYVRDPVSKNIYSTVNQHTSDALATDISAGRMQLAINVEDVELAQVAAEAARDAAQGFANDAQLDAIAASGSASAASGSASAAAGSASAALASEQAALASEQAAEASELAAAQSAIEAAASAASIDPSNLVTLTGTQTLTNKTIAFGSNTLTDVASTSTAQTITGAKRGAVTTDNDLSFSMTAGNNFSCTTSGSGTLTFTNITAGQSGFILLVNASNHTISAAATTKITAADLTRISATGTYLLSYFSNGTNVYISASGNVA